MTLYILNYNNYYNRIVKRELDLSAYLDHEVVYVVENTNFNENDGISTSHVIGCASGGSYTGKGDYAIAVNDNGEIASRWFIIEAVRTRAGQYRLELYRDTIVDYYDLVINSPMFIEKATVAQDNPLLFNNENMTFNQIKSNEYLLKDKTECAWLVGYYAKDASELKGTVPTNNAIDLNYIALNVPTIADWEFYNANLIGPAQSGTYNFTVAMGPAMSPSVFNIKVNEKTGDTQRTQRSNITVQLQNLQLLTEEQIKNGFVSFGLSNLDSTPYSNTSSKSIIDDLLQYQGKLVRTGDGAYYEVKIASNTRTETISISSGALFNNLTTVLQNLGFFGTPNTSTYSYTFTSTYYSVNVIKKQELETKYDITATTRLVTTDAPWNIFAIPFGQITIKGVESGDIITSADIGISAASAISAQQQTKIYDIQLLPYCPMQELISGNREITVRNNLQYSLIKNDTDAPVGIIFNIPSSNFTFDITSITLPTAASALERKVNNECDKWRLTSPNYSNYFDFSVEKNGGVQFFNVDCNYKPYNPYIHINPNFSGLYGQDYNDPRGLILGGDFSISQIGDAWKQYEIQNKNYQLSFDRQIQNIEVNNNISRFKERLSASVGVVAGAAGGAASGAMLVGGSGALAGGIVGAGATTVGGIMDIRINEKLRNEALDYTIDQFGYNLGNIQALPQTISKISAFNLNNKIFPVLEYYTATDVEKQALKDKIKYNGMTVMVIGKMQDYIQAASSYIKGQLIRLEPDMGEDYHIINTIAGELNKGVYI